jgi:hypothetical protein
VKLNGVLGSHVSPYRATIFIDGEKLMGNRKSDSAVLAITMVAGALMLGLFATPAQAALRHLDGTILSKNVSAKTFQISTQSGNKVRIKINANTVFQRITGGFAGIQVGMRVEIEAKQTSNGLLAKHVEPKEGGGGGGGGADNPPNHG